ncbi:MAG TPA: cytochrome c [Terracidiphilus sp.]
MKSHLSFLRRSLLHRHGRIALFVLALFAVAAPALSAQTLKYTRKPDPQNGSRLYHEGCIVCHGETGRGAPMDSTQFKRPGTFPDFTACSQTTPEPNANWKAVIKHGGPSRGFSTIMPAFGDLLSDNQIDDLIAYLRGYCSNPHWPRGELNLPRAIATEKAFPENELVLTSAVNASGAPGFTVDVIHEQSFGKKSQLEIDVPITAQDVNHAWDSHIGDITFGWKQVVFSNLHTGSILAVQGGVIPPTGTQRLGGAGTTTFEPFLSFDQLFTSNTWVQFQMGAELPHDTKKAPQNIYWRTALGQTLAADNRLGRQWSPMVEFLASRDLEDGAKTNWDVMPEMQVTISRRQHIRANIGVRAPFTNTADRSPEVDFYLLWDWADGKFWEGWK